MKTLFHTQESCATIHLEKTFPIHFPQVAYNAARAAIAAVVDIAVLIVAPLSGKVFAVLIWTILR